MKKFFSLIICLSVTFVNIFASAEDKPLVAVMNFGQYDGAVTDALVIDNVGAMSADYIIQALVESNYFQVVSTHDLQNSPELQDVKLSGIIPPSTARKIAAVLGIKYVLYGNVSGLSGSSTSLEVIGSGGSVHTVKAQVIARMMDVETGEIIAAVKGVGSSKSSIVKVGVETAGYIKIGTTSVSQVSVHNAVKKASYSMVSMLLERLYNVQPKKIEELFKGKLK